MLKDRSKQREPKKEIISVRVTENEKRLLIEKFGRRNVSSVVRVRVLNELLGKPKKRAPYKCFSCGKRIEVEELYYCELANLEKFVNAEPKSDELEIEVIESVPVKILCFECARKKRKLANFEMGGSETQVRSSERILDK